ncbi:MAG TPA: hypothetical protein VJZ93_04265 [Candidatus Nanoarchaeia archaeon]|nr:hypothetical protein [Candidatus Nanoarchaeia archaeon]
MNMVAEKEDVREFVNNDALWLVIGDNDESQMALDFLKRNKLNPEILIGTGRAFSGGYDDSRVPLSSAVLYEGSSKNATPLIVVKKREMITSTWCYRSFDGVKAYVREKLGEELFGDKFGTNPIRFWREIDTFYNDRDRKRDATFFELPDRVSYKGDIDSAPYNLKSQLPESLARGWHDVSGWKVGNIERLLKLEDKKGWIIDRDTKTILTGHEIRNLINDRVKNIVTKNSSSIYHKEYGAYYKSGNNLCGIYASMQD